MAAPTPAELLCQRARDLIRRRQFAEAIAVYEEALQVEPRDIRAHEGIATAAFLANDYDRAEQHFKRLAQIDPRRADPLVNLGAVYNRRGDFDNAVKILRQALSRNRKCAEAYYNLGIAHKGQNQLSMAVSAYREAIRLAPEMAEAYHNLGNAYVDMGNLQQAMLNFRRALEINPAFERAQRGLENAQKLSHEYAAQINPLGRLVDTQQLERQKALAASTAGLREMSDEERTQDRSRVHKQATVFEAAAGEVLTQLKERLSPALLTVMHAMAQSEDKWKLLNTQATVSAAIERHRQTVAPLLKAADDLQAYEEQLQHSLRRDARQEASA